MIQNNNTMGEGMPWNFIMPFFWLGLYWGIQSYLAELKKEEEQAEAASSQTNENERSN